jgi:hypothetical protein
MNWKGFYRTDCGWEKIEIDFCVTTGTYGTCCNEEGGE